MRTIVYVDGCNLFYSVLSKLPYKWLDLGILFGRYLIHSVVPESEIVLIKYFTAPVLGRMANDPRAEQRQAHYHRALKAMGNIAIIKGYHQKAITTGTPVEVERPDNVTGKPRVYVMEEKQTDVNISLHMYRDAAQNNCEQIVLCSNDADLEPALKMIREDFPDIRTGLIVPRYSENNKSRLSECLMQHVHWKRRNIRKEELEASQLPEVLLDHRNRTIRRPEEW